MKIHHRIICVVLCLAFTLCLCACTNESTELTTISEQNTISIVFSEKFLNVAEVSPENWIESLDNLGADQYVNLRVSDGGKSVTLDVTDSQKDFWISVVDDGLHKLESDFQSINSNYDINYSDDYSCIALYYNLDLPASDAIYYVIYCEVYCAFGQLLNGEDSQAWVVNCNIYNSETGKLVTSGDSDTGLSYESSDWEASK